MGFCPTSSRTREGVPPITWAGVVREALCASDSQYHPHFLFFLKKKTAVERPPAPGQAQGSQVRPSRPGAASNPNGQQPVGDPMIKKKRLRVLPCSRKRFTFLLIP